MSRPSSALGLRDQTCCCGLLWRYDGSSLRRSYQLSVNDLSESILFEVVIIRNALCLHICCLLNDVVEFSTNFVQVSTFSKGFHINVVEDGMNISFESSFYLKRSEFFIKFFDIFLGFGFTKDDKSIIGELNSPFDENFELA